MTTSRRQFECTQFGIPFSFSGVSSSVCRHSHTTIGHTPILCRPHLCAVLFRGTTRYCRHHARRYRARFCGPCGRYRGAIALVEIVIIVPSLGLGQYHHVRRGSDGQLHRQRLRRLIRKHVPQKAGAGEFPPGHARNPTGRLKGLGRAALPHHRPNVRPSSLPGRHPHQM